MLGQARCFFLFAFLRICAKTQKEMHIYQQVIKCFCVYVLFFNLWNFINLKESVYSKYVVVIALHSF